MAQDVIVVGAGPAGSSTAYHLARRGRRVLLLDRRSFPRDKSCGDGLTLPALRLLDEMGVLALLEGPRRVDGVRALMRGRGHRDFRYPATKGGLAYGLVVPRHELDAAICARAVAAGAELRENCLVRGVIRVDGAVAGVTLRHGDAQEELFAPAVIR